MMDRTMGTMGTVGTEHAIDIVDFCELSGVQLHWLRERAADEAAHYVTLEATGAQPPQRHGSYTRTQARVVFEAMRAALVAAARQQSTRLQRLVQRRQTR